MNKKVITIVLIILFIIILILLSMLINNQNKLIVNKNSDREESKVEILKITSENFEEEVLKSEKTVLIDFYADWCGPCKMLSPIVEEVAAEREDLKVVKINIDDEQELAIKYDVMSIPTLVVIKSGEEVNRGVGLMNRTAILNLVK